MKTAYLVLFAIAITLAGCIPSLHPLYTDNTIVYVANLLGTWKQDPNKPDTWIFQKEGTNHYKLTVIDEKNKSGDFEAYLCKLDDKLFLDIFPEDPNLVQNDFYQLHLFPCHGIIKVDQISPDLKLQMIDPDKFKKMLDSDPDLIKHEIVKDRVLLTASTAQLQEFMKKNSDKEWLFGDPATFKKMPADPNGGAVLTK